jgi:type IV secretion system protein VirB6
LTCPAIPIGDTATITSVLSSIDCQVNQGVASAYGRLFATGGVFSVALTALLTIYVALVAFGFLTGRTRMTLPALAPKAVALALVLTFATSWQAYDVVIHGLLTAGPDQIAATFMGAPDGATHAFTSRLDVLFARVVEAAQSVSALNPEAAQNAGIAKPLVWASGLTLLFTTLGLLVAARVILALLLGLGPVFVVLALFDVTRGLFDAWLRTTVAVAFAPMLIVLAGSGVMALLAPMIAAIVQDPAGAVQSLRPIVMLLLGVAIYALLLTAATWTAISLTRGWRPRVAAAASDALPNDERTTASERMAFVPHARDRNSELIAAIVRERAPALPPPVALDSPQLDPASLRRPRPRRIGLGRSYRTDAA